jgi:hypothetical protein
MCRICLEEGPRREFIAPCSCRGTSKWVHRHCLDKWRSTREDKAFSRCMECQKNYELVSVTEEQTDSRCSRRVLFYSLAARDITLIVAIIVLLLSLVSAIVFGLDLLNQNELLHWLHMEKHEFVFYVFCGLALTFAYIGLHFCCVYSGICSPCETSICPSGCEDHYNCGCDNRCSDSVFIPYYVTPDLHPSCCCLECGQCSCGECFGVGGSGASEGIASFSCCEGSTASCGQELLVVALVIFVILAAVGAIISIFLGAFVLQAILKKHLHVLGKWTMTKEFIVRDLAEKDQETTTCRSIGNQQRFEVEGNNQNNDAGNSPIFANTFWQTIMRRGSNRQQFPIGQQYQSIELNNHEPRELTASQTLELETMGLLNIQ